MEKGHVKNWFVLCDSKAWMVWCWWIRKDKCKWSHVRKTYTYMLFWCAKIQQKEREAMPILVSMGLTSLSALLFDNYFLIRTSYRSYVSSMFIFIVLSLYLCPSICIWCTWSFYQNNTSLDNWPRICSLQLELSYPATTLPYSGKWGMLE